MFGFQHPLPFATSKSYIIYCQLSACCLTPYYLQPIYLREIKKLSLCSQGPHILQQHPGIFLTGCSLISTNELSELHPFQGREGSRDCWLPFQSLYISLFTFNSSLSLGCYVLIFILYMVAITPIGDSPTNFILVVCITCRNPPAIGAQTFHNAR